jgi:anti-sigma factor (TIGR02949 family)
MECCGRIAGMTCDEAEILLHALIDGELDAGHARDVEAHVATCAGCAEKLKAFRAMRTAMAATNLKEAAPAQLRSRIEAALALPPVTATAPAAAPRRTLLESLRGSWQTFVGGFATGGVLSAAVAASLMLAVFHNDQNREIASEVVSAHLRSLQAGHLTDVETSDQHTVKPWFNGKLDVAPPVIDLTAQGFTLIGGRLDYINGQPVGSIVYRRRKHVINLFVGQQLGTPVQSTKDESVQGFNIRHWREEGLDFWAVSDIDEAELDEFAQKIAVAVRAPS